MNDFGGTLRFYIFLPMVAQQSRALITSDKPYLALLLFAH